MFACRVILLLVFVEVRSVQCDSCGGRCSKVSRLPELLSELLLPLPPFIAGKYNMKSPAAYKPFIARFCASIQFPSRSVRRQFSTTSSNSNPRFSSPTGALRGTPSDGSTSVGTGTKPWLQTQADNKKNQVKWPSQLLPM